MKRMLLSFIIVFVSLFSLPTSSLSSSPPDLNYTEQIVLPAVDPSIVLRQHQIAINSDQLSSPENEVIHIDLFDDVSIVAELLKHSSMPDGTFVWEGQVRGFSSSRVLLVVNGARVSGEIALPGSLYHVRSLDAGIYIAQEINQTLVTERETRAFLNISVTDEVIALTNQERAKHGLHDLFYDYRLTLAAQGHADDMAQNNYFSHTSLDGRSPSQRITATGYIWNYAAENIAAGYTSAATVVNGWINSPGHHANMISPTSCDIGVGYAYNSNDPSMYYHYWVQNFGRLMGVSTCPAVPAGSKPDVSTGTATQAGMDSVQLNGTINPNGLVTTYYFEIGLTNAYGSTTTRSDTAAGTSPLSVQATLTGLSRFTTYHYRLVAYNSRGITYGQDATFSIVDQVLPIGGLLLLLR